MKEVSSFRFIYTGIESNRIECLYYIGCACDFLKWLLWWWLLRWWSLWWWSSTTNKRESCEFVAVSPLRLPNFFFLSTTSTPTYFIKGIYLSCWSSPLRIKQEAAAVAWRDFLLSDRQVSTANVQMCSCCTYGKVRYVLCVWSLKLVVKEKEEQWCDVKILREWIL